MGVVCVVAHSACTWRRGAQNADGSIHRRLRIPRTFRYLADWNTDSDPEISTGKDGPGTHFGSRVSNSLSPRERHACPVKGEMLPR